jgi:hypothetical protein
MKKSFAVVVMVAAISIGAADVLQQFGVNAKAASEEVVNAIAYGHVNVYRVRSVFKPASPAVRAALVEQAMSWTKGYVNSAAFAKDYATFRESVKPRLEERPSIDEELAAQRAERAASLEEAKKNIATMPAEYKKMAEDGYKAMVESYKQLDTPEFRKMERDGLVMQRQGEEQRHREEIAKWEASYPAEPRTLVKKRLQQFLTATADVDFAAKTEPKYGKDRFVNAAYEKKPSEWKLAYRAGKEPTEKARAFAKAWLAELE